MNLRSTHATNETQATHPRSQNVRHAQIAMPAIAAQAARSARRHRLRSIPNQRRNAAESAFFRWPPKPAPNPCAIDAGYRLSVAESTSTGRRASSRTAVRSPSNVFHSRRIRAVSLILAPMRATPVGRALFFPEN
ncbi:hypothetical protein C7S16_6495 [Burkholderia thailandensis]|uniref:Uncharacterized protein n=1 Tax=Burkholderia thailandensis TaxID=57975 RepID=A0AAW9CTW3_BURTH|nr:hypothetical protein [Burkholderia thailandensis]MDW9252553.1 hypothetical protein [Burkholderia thailandensis]